MKLSDFLQLFHGMSPSSEVSFKMDVGCCGDFEQLDNPDVDEYNGFVFVSFPALDFLSSCRTYGNAKDKK